MPGHDVIAIGASAGGVETLTRLVGGLPADLPAAVFVSLHVPSHGISVLPQILSRNGSLAARHPADGDPIKPGRIYVAPPDHHMLLQRGRVRLSRGPRENGFRPAIDPLFRSAARWYGSRAVGVVLSGTLDDGSAGLIAIKERGGIAVVQDPADALFPGMPRNAIEVVSVDHVLPVANMPALLDQLARQEAGPEVADSMTDEMEIESEIAGFDLQAIQRDDHPGAPSGFACPDCAGVLWELVDGEMIRYRCRVGHAWSPTSLLSEQSHSLETALWTALRALEERAALAARMAERFRTHGKISVSARFIEQARAAKEQSAVIRQVLMKEPKAEVEGPVDSEGEPG